MEIFGLDLAEWLKGIGMVGLLAIIFTESGLLVGFFLPGDSLLFTAGLLASQGYLNLWILLIGGALAAVAGDNVGYHLGRRFGSRIFNREDSLFFHKDHVVKAEKFYRHYGPMTIVLARFMPFIRTFAPILAGVGRMDYSTFFFYNVIGGIFWVLSMGLLGYFLGTVVPDIDRYILPIVGLIVILSIAPGVLGYLKSRRHRS